MKSIAAVIVLMCLGTGTLAQQTAQQQQTAPPAKMECRDLSATGSVVLPNESLVNGMAFIISPPPKAAPVNPAPGRAPVSLAQYTTDLLKRLRPPDSTCS